MPAEPLPPAAELESRLWHRLGQRRRSPLEPGDLVRSYGLVGSADLRWALAEQLGERGPSGWPPLRGLAERHGPEPALVHAIGLSRHPDARSWLLARLDEAQGEPAALLRALCGWAAELDRSVLRHGLQQPDSASRLAALDLLLFQLRRIEAGELLQLCRPALEDPRPPVVLACLKVLQRRDDRPVVDAILRLADGGQPTPVVLAAIGALGCIGTADSVRALIRCDATLQQPDQRLALHRQIRAQFRHLAVAREEIAAAVAAERMTAQRGRQLLELLTTSCRAGTCRTW